jgi:hypothetical protein
VCALRLEAPYDIFCRPYWCLLIDSLPSTADDAVRLLRRAAAVLASSEVFGEKLRERVRLDVASLGPVIAQNGARQNSSNR